MEKYYYEVVTCWTKRQCVTLCSHLFLDKTECDGLESTSIPLTHRRTRRLWQNRVAYYHWSFCVPVVHVKDVTEIQCNEIADTRVSQH